MTLREEGPVAAVQASTTTHSCLPAMMAASSEQDFAEGYSRVRCHTLARRREEEETVSSVRLLSEAYLEKRKQE